MTAFDQQPEGWSSGASGYAEQFMGHTRLYAADALELMGVGVGTTLLDVAAGTGAATLEAAARGATVVATDFAAGMVAQLRTVVDAAGLGAAVTAEVMDGQALTLTDDCVDAAISMFGWMFFPDTDAGLHELRRVVRPGGRVALGIWNGEGFGLRQLIGQAMTQVFGDSLPPQEPPSFARLFAHDTFAAEVAAAGFTDTAVHTVWHRWTLADPRTFFETMPEWTPVWQPIKQHISDADWTRLANAFVDEVERTERDPQGLAVAADICVGTVPG